MSADSTSVGIQDTFSQNQCTYKNTTSSWSIFTWAYPGPASGEDFNYQSHITLVNALTDSNKINVKKLVKSNKILIPGSSTSNEDLAAAVTKAVTTNEPDKVWAVLINDVGTSDSYMVSDFNLTSNWPSIAESNNFCGKNIVVYGGPYSGSDLECTDPALGFFEYFHYVASEATSISGANVSTVVNMFNDKGLEYSINGELIMVAKDAKAGIKHALSPLCEYDSGDSYSPWKILYYGTSM